MSSNYLPQYFFNRVQCPECCGWVGDVTELQLARRISDSTLVCLCPECDAVVMEQLDQATDMIQLASTKEIGDEQRAYLQDKGYTPESVSES